jgi:outer membrane lipoprotein-sorting protein
MQQTKTNFTSPLRAWGYILGFLLLTFNISSAQSNATAEQIIGSILSDVKVNAIKTNFKLAISDKSNPQGQVSNGTFTLKGNKFVLEMDEMKVYFDGKTQWSYIAQNNEVSITEPSEKELSETNPMAILSSFKTKSSIRFSSKNKSAENQYIEMIPKNKLQDITKIEVLVNKNSSSLISIKLINKNGSVTQLSLSNYQKGVKVADNNFIFVASKFKEVLINDLR